MAEVQKADPRTGRAAAIIVVAATLVGALLITAADQLQPGVRAWVLQNPAARIRIVILVLVLLTTGPVLGVAAYVWNFGSRIVGAGRYPPPGVRVYRDTPVLTGEPAVARGRIYKIFGAFFGVAGFLLAFFLWRLMVMAGTGAALAIGPQTARAQIASGEFNGLLLGVDASTGVVTGYFEDYTGVDQQFSCVFYLRGTIKGQPPYEILTWFPGDTNSSDVIAGTIDPASTDGNELAIRLKEEHGGCWNVRHFADAEAASFAAGEKGEWREIRIVSSATAVVHDQPRADTARAAYVVEGNALRVHDSISGWIRAEYRGDRGRTTGWIRDEDLFSSLPPGGRAER
jgi:hypothetical protein